MTPSALTRSASRWAASLLEPPQAEGNTSILFQEEARAERLVNVIRVLYMLTFLAVAAWHWPTVAKPVFNTINVIVGCTWLLAALVYHELLLRIRYRPFLKYASTTFDMVMATLMLAAYEVVAGPAFAFKMPIFLNYFCLLGFAALRFHRGLAVFASALSSGLFLCLWIWADLGNDIVYGNSIAHATSAGIHAKYMVDEILYLVCFGMLLMAVSINARRLIGLRVAERERAAREEERSLMAAGLAHEIKNPLAGLYGAAQVLKEQGRSDPRLMDIILGDARRLVDVVEDFMRDARPYSIRPEPVDAVALAKEFCAEQTGLFPERPIACILPEVAAPLRTDPVAVRQILINLVQNARRYQASGAPVRFGIIPRGDQLEFHVEDDGPGVEPDLRASLFEPIRPGRPDGNGLGLALSRRIARALGGELSYEPLTPGSRFVLSLPHATGARA
jgi:signal transduction histidine kinase